MAEPERPCQHCHAPIFFARTPARRLMPFDADPLDARHLQPGERWTFDPESLTCAKVPDQATGPVYVPHFATCPHSRSVRPPEGPVRDRWDANREGYEE